jgi:hypothetical protein
MSIMSKNIYKHVYQQICVVSCVVSFCIVLYLLYTVIYCGLMFCTVINSPCCIQLNCTVLWCSFISYSTLLHCTALHCAVQDGYETSMKTIPWGTYLIVQRAFSVIPVKHAATAIKNMDLPKNTCTCRYAALSASGNLGYRKPKNPQTS